jgi:hypothetical protein
MIMRLPTENLGSKVRSLNLEYGIYSKAASTLVRAGVLRAEELEFNQHSATTSCTWIYPELAPVQGSKSRATKPHTTIQESGCVRRNICRGIASLSCPW